MIRHVPIIRYKDKIIKNLGEQKSKQQLRCFVCILYRVEEQTIDLVKYTMVLLNSR